MKLAGAAYLAYLGVQALRSSFRNDTAETPTARRRANPFVQGVFSNMLYPKGRGVLSDIHAAVHVARG